MFESLPCQSQGNKCRNSVLITCHYPDIIVVAAVFYDHWHNPKSDLGGHFNAICLKSNRKVQTAIQNANFLHWICVSQSGRKLQTVIQNGEFDIEYASVKLIRCDWQKIYWIIILLKVGQQEQQELGD